MSMTKFECAVDYAWSNLKLGENDYIPKALSAGSDAIDLLREYYEAYRSGTEVPFYAQRSADSLLEEWDK